jgi:hypothetical protein
VTNLLEDPTPIILAGIAIEALLGIALVVTRRGVVLLPMAFVALLTLAGVIVERLVVTDTEQVEAVIEAGRSAAEKNDVQAALALVAPSGEQIRRDARDVFAEVTFRELKVRGLKITVDRQAKPPSAKADFTAIAEFDSRRGNVPYRNYVATVTVELQRRGDRWLVVEVGEIRAGIRRTEPITGPNPH